MKQITLEGIRKPIFPLIMGSDLFDPEQTGMVADLLDEFFVLGGNMIDTAHIYVGGKSEQAIGQWMQMRGNRRDLLILTKGGHHDKHGPRVNAECIALDLAESLERLQTDYIDLYMLHRDDSNIPVSHIMDAVHAHKEAGRIHAFGVSNWTGKRIQEANEYAYKHDLTPISASSPNLSLAKPNEPRWEGCISVDENEWKWYEQSGMPLFSWSSQASGFFKDRFSPEKRDNEEIVRVYYHDRNWERKRRAGELARGKGVETVQISLAYVLNQPFPTAALIGPRTKEEMRSCFDARKIELTPEEIRWLDLLDE